MKTVKEIKTRIYRNVSWYYQIFSLKTMVKNQYIEKYQKQMFVLGVFIYVIYETVINLSISMFVSLLEYLINGTHWWNYTMIMLTVLFFWILLFNIIIEIFHIFVPRKFNVNNFPSPKTIKKYKKINKLEKI